MHENLKGLDAFLRRHARYAELEAERSWKSREGSDRGQRRGRLSGSWPSAALRQDACLVLDSVPPGGPLCMDVLLSSRGFLDGPQAASTASSSPLTRRSSTRSCSSWIARRPDRLPAIAPQRRRSRSSVLTVTARSRSVPSPTPARRVVGVIQIVDGIPLFLVDVTAAQEDEDRSPAFRSPPARSGLSAQERPGDALRSRDRPAFEINRPRGTPRLYQFFLAEKFRQATAPIASQVAGASALTVCGGSGTDAEFLALAGARVVSSDISLGAASPGQRASTAAAARYHFDRRRRRVAAFR